MARDNEARPLDQGVLDDLLRPVLASWDTRGRKLKGVQIALDVEPLNIF